MLSLGTWKCKSMYHELLYAFMMHSTTEITNLPTSYQMKCTKEIVTHIKSLLVAI